MVALSELTGDTRGVVVLESVSIYMDIVGGCGCFLASGLALHFEGESCMSRRKGFMGGLLHELEVAQRNNQRASATAVRERARAEREAQRAHAAAQRALVANAKGAARSAADAEKAAKQSHVEEQEADTALLNAELEVRLGEIDMLLLSGLEASQTYVISNR